MPQAATITVSRPEPDIALLTLDQPDKGANVLSQHVLAELAAHLDQLEQDANLAGLIIMSGKPGMFIAGADLREFVASFGSPSETTVAMCRKGQQLFGRLARTPFVTIAAIDGICVGGGAELSIWCDRRIVSDNPKTQFGFPEVKLGLYPGWGGTVRAPRIMGLGNAVELITGGEPLSADETVKTGLAQGPVAADRLLAAAIDEVRDARRTGQFLRDREAWAAPLNMPENELAFLGVTASAYIRGQTNDQYPAPLAALEVMLESSQVDAEQACINEAEGMAQLFGSPINQALVNVFFLTDRNKKDRGVDQADVQPREVGRVGVIGAGIMGSGIAGANLKRGVGVLLSDAAEAALAKGGRVALEEAAFDRRFKGPAPDKLLELAPHLQLSTFDEAYRACDLVIEAVVENLQVKRQVYQRVEAMLPEHAVLASNTSTIPITTLAESLQHPERFCGIHFFNPVRRMKLVEVIRGAKTDDATIATAVAYAKRLGKMPIVVDDGPGFLVNRLLFPYMNESLELLSQGVEIKAVERAAKAFGMPMGPIELYDMVGLDTALYAGKTMWEAFPKRIHPSPILPALVKAGRLGQKSGQGFFAYGGGKRNKPGKPQPAPEAEAIVNNYIKRRETFTPEQLQHRLFLPMLLEATRVLEAGLVRDARDVDLGLIFGLGFPPFKGGLLFWADQVGAATIVEWLKPHEALGERMQPTPLLLEMAREGRKFYQ